MLKRFCRAETETHGATHLRSLTLNDVLKILKVSEKCDTSRLLVSIDCWKWIWKNCVTDWHEQFRVKKKAPTVALMALCDRSLKIWCAFFGMPGSLNNIIVLIHRLYLKRSLLELFHQLLSIRSQERVETNLACLPWVLSKNSVFYRFYSTSGHSKRGIVYFCPRVDEKNIKHAFAFSRKSSTSSSALQSSWLLVP